jgi:hypothetical protein
MSSVSDVRGIGAQITLRPSFRNGRMMFCQQNRQPTRRGPTQPWRSEQSELIATPRVACQELLHRGGNFDNVRLEREMPGIQELDPRVRYVFRNASAPAGMKKGSFLPQIASNGGFAFRK